MSEVDELLVCVRGRLAEVPEIALPDGFRVRTMDPEDPAEVERWLAVHNAAFDRTWTPENHHLGMAVNPVVVVDQTFLAERAGQVVGTASIGRFRGNLEVGVGHYLAVHPAARRSGLATALCSVRYRALAEQGIEVGETQTHVHRVGSLKAHFRCGFAPKGRVDPWNSLTPTSGPLREAADQRLAEAYAEWQAAG